MEIVPDQDNTQEQEQVQTPDGPPVVGFANITFRQRDTQGYDISVESDLPLDLMPLMLSPLVVDGLKRLAANGFDRAEIVELLKPIAHIGSHYTDPTETVQVPAKLLMDVNTFVIAIGQGQEDVLPFAPETAPE